MKVRIENNGERGYMTRVTEAETGKVLDLHIQEVSIKVFDDMPHAILTSALPVLDIIADAEIRYVCPSCGHTKWKPLDIESIKQLDSIDRHNNDEVQ
jgi:hypothetical protein